MEKGFATVKSQIRWFFYLKGDYWLNLMKALKEGPGSFLKKTDTPVKVLGCHVKRGPVRLLCDKECVWPRELRMTPNWQLKKGPQASQFCCLYHPLFLSNPTSHAVFSGDSFLISLLEMIHLWTSMVSCLCFHYGLVRKYNKENQCSNHAHSHMVPTTAKI